MKITRRDVLKAGLLVGGSVLTGCGTGLDPLQLGETPGPTRPNLLVLITDQEREHVHWPAGMLDRLMPSWARLRRHGLKFRRAYCASSQCSPSRACMLTGEYSNVNGVPTLPDDGMPTLPDLPNLASVLGAAGYEVIWKGKWHLSFPEDFPPNTKPSEEVWLPQDIPALEQKYGVAEWNPPDAGNNAGAFGTGGVPSMGGGLPDNDGRFVRGITDPQQTAGVAGGESVLQFLERWAGTPTNARKPFALFVSLVNPHDITFFPNGWDLGGYQLADFENLGVALPANFNDPLTSKPSVQRDYRDGVQALDPLADNPALGTTYQQYVNFYAYLHSVVDPQIETVLDALDRHGLTDDTILVRTADHGEGGLSHGLREKSYSAYEEMIHVPLVISNPRLFPEPRETDALYSHVDLLPTLAELAQAQPVGVGKSAVPVLLDPEATVQDCVLFTFDDNFVLPTAQPGSHIRALRTDRWTYGVYYGENGGPFEFELYDNEADPLQLNNLVFQAEAAIIPQWRALHTRLIQKMQETRSTPEGFVFPADPTLV